MLSSQERQHPTIQINYHGRASCAEATSSGLYRLHVAISFASRALYGDFGPIRNVLYANETHKACSSRPLD